MILLDQDRLNRQVVAVEFTWGGQVIHKVPDKGQYGTPANLGLFRFYHGRMELHYLNGPLDDMFYGMASIFVALGYTIIDKREGRNV